MAGVETMNDVRFELGIAGLSLAASGPEQWVAPLRHAWSPWRPEEGLPSWSLTVAADESLEAPRAPLFEAVPQCRDGLCTLAAPGFAGRIDARAGEGRLRAHPRAEPNDAGYFLRVALALQAFTRGGLLFHAAGVVHRGKGYAFFGLSGSGKTTAARLSTPDPVLNDDLLLLWPEADRWWIYSTPFGKGRGSLQRAPLRALLRLIKDTEVFLAPMAGGRALGELVANTPVLSGDARSLPEVIARWRAIRTGVPVQALHFRRDPTFWEVIDAHLE